MTEAEGCSAGLIISPEQVEQRASVEEVHRLAFGGPFEAEVVARIRQSPQFLPPLSLVARQAEQVVGHVLFSRVYLRDAGDRQQPVVLLAPLAVRPEWSGRGIGSALVRAGLSRLRELDEALVVVRGHPIYYRRLGFMAADQVGISPPSPLPPQEYSALRLSGSRSPKGILVYPPAFEVLGYSVEPHL